MRRVTAVAVLSLSLAALSSRSGAQDARQRQAAADAYDRGTTAYVDQSYEEAARWFETANRLAPAAPALMQAIRAHERNDNAARAATLALELASTYREDSAATEFANGVLDRHAASLLRVQVTCDEECKLDLDGKLEEYLAFFVAPDVAHRLTATFETGSKKTNVQGAAGETREVRFEAPPAPPSTPLVTTHIDNGAEAGPHAPLSPLFTWIGVGITVALGAATIISGVDAKSGVPGYEKAAQQSRDCMSMGTMDCTMLAQKAASLLDSGQGKELRTNVLIGVTAAAAVGTGVIAFVLTDWSGGDEREQNATAVTDAKSRWRSRLSLAPRLGGAAAVYEAKF
jgi:hypothetical protein